MTQGGRPGERGPAGPSPPLKTGPSARPLGRLGERAGSATGREAARPEGAERAAGTIVVRGRARGVPSPWWGVLGFVAIVVGVWATGQGLIYWWKTSAPKERRVPHVVGKEQAEAEATLRAEGLSAEVVERRLNERAPEGRVLWAEPQAGRMVKEGRKVSLVVSAGSAWAKVPRVRGKPVEDGGAALEAVHLTVGKLERTYHDSIEFGSVVDTRPAEGTKLKRGSKVNLLVSQGPRPAEEGGFGLGRREPFGSAQGQPSDSGARQGEIEVEVPPGASLQEVKIVVHDDNGEHVVYDDFHAPGEVVQQQVEGEGRTTVRVYVAGTLTREQELPATQAPSTGETGD